MTTRFRRTKRASTVAIDEGRVSRHIVPILGNKVAGQLTRADVQRMVDAIAAGKTAATIKTKARGVARVTGGAGTATRVAGQNLVRGLDLRADEARDHVLSTGELAALGMAIDAEGPSMAANALRLIALTALRRGEAYALRWREIDFEGSCLRLETTKTGRSTRPIGKEAINLLRSLPQLNDEWVFPNRSGNGPAELKKHVAAIFDAAGLNDARGHDMRRTFASLAADCGYSNATIGELIGHAKRGVTEKHYVRRPDAALVEAATRVSARVATAMDSNKKGDVVELTLRQAL